MFTLLVFDREARKVLALDEFENADEAFRRHLENVERYDGRDAVLTELFAQGKKQLLADFPWYGSRTDTSYSPRISS